MKIAVWCASETGTDPAFAEMAADLGRCIAERGCGLVYGGSRGGLMGTVADACLAAGGEVTGVSVDVPRIVARQHPGLTACEFTPDMITRKARMIELADAFVALPGGPGTFDEIGDVITLLRAGVTTKPIALLNVTGFYDPLQELFDRMTEARFVADEDFSRVLITPSLEEALAFIGA
mgnify:CR=1 FL=1